MFLLQSQVHEDYDCVVVFVLVIVVVCLHHRRRRRLRRCRRRHRRRRHPRRPRRHRNPRRLVLRAIEIKGLGRNEVDSEKKKMRENVTEIKMCCFRRG